MNNKIYWKADEILIGRVTFLPKAGIPLYGMKFYQQTFNDDNCMHTLIILFVISFTDSGRNRVFTVQ